MSIARVLRRCGEPRLEMLRDLTSMFPEWYGGASSPAKAVIALWLWKRLVCIG